MIPAFDSFVNTLAVSKNYKKLGEMKEEIKWEKNIQYEGREWTRESRERNKVRKDNMKEENE